MRVRGALVRVAGEQARRVDRVGLVEVLADDGALGERAAGKGDQAARGEGQEGLGFVGGVHLAVLLVGGFFFSSSTAQARWTKGQLSAAEVADGVTVRQEACACNQPE